MNADLKEAFSHIKPVCDVVMISPSQDNLAAYVARVSQMKKEALQELQQYILFPLITHVNSKEIEKKYELQWKMIDAMRTVLERVTVKSYEMCLKIETGPLNRVFDSSKPGMVADVPEELKLSVMKCLTALMLNIDKSCREKLLKLQVPLLAQAVFVSVHIAKQEKYRALRLEALNCLTAHTAVHRQLTDDKYHISDPAIETLVVDMLSSILPGVLAALQDVATCSQRPGHAVVMAALDATHRIICITMHDKYVAKEKELTAGALAALVKEKASLQDKEVSYKDKDAKDIEKRSPEWYKMAGDKLTVVTKSLAVLRTHEHHLVRKELAVYCYRLLSECNVSMQLSVPLALDVLISLANDLHPAVAEYCARAVNSHFACAGAEARGRALDSLCYNFFAMLTCLPRILNNVDASRKVSALNLLRGYIELLCDESRPQRLTTALGAVRDMHACCAALLHAAALAPPRDRHRARHPPTDVTAPPPTSSPWCRLHHLDTEECEMRLQGICQLLGAAECSELIVDRLLEMFHNERTAEIVYLMNWMASAPASPASMAKRILDTYIDEDVWYLPLEVGSGEPPITNEETLDVSVYNPRAWVKESVPDLYEGATETRYTDISYQTPRVQYREPNTCASLAEAQRNLTLSCLLTEGVGVMAKRLGEQYQPYLLKTLCLILERVGSMYEMLHLAGLKAINDIALACGHASVAELIQHNADYFTSQITVKLKKAWDTQSALQILSVVMEYSDKSILDCLYGIVRDVLVQSCDKYHEKDLLAYLQVFLTFIECINKWFPQKHVQKSQNSSTNEINIHKDVIEYVANIDECERLLSDEQFEKESGKSVEEMYREDQKAKEDNLLDYDDTVTHETPPPPHHVAVTIAVLKRCQHFITSKRRDEAILAMQVLTRGLPVLKAYEDHLLPLVHQCWAPLVAKFEDEPAVVKRALELLVTMAELSRDFIRSRAVKEVLPHLYKYLHKSASESHLKDAGSAYRNSQAYSLQVATLGALSSLAVDLMLEDERLEDAMACVDMYLSNKQPKPLQTLAVQFFQVILEYDYGAAWHHLRKLCNNDKVLEPPPSSSKMLKLEPVIGTPYEPSNKDYMYNVDLIFKRES